MKSFPKQVFVLIDHDEDGEETIYADRTAEGVFDCTQQGPEVRIARYVLEEEKSYRQTLIEILH